MTGPGDFDRARGLDRLADTELRRPRRRRRHHRRRRAPSTPPPGACAPRWSSGTTSPRAPRRSPPSWSTAASATSSSGEIRLVYEALHERQRLLRNAPHLVQRPAVPHPDVHARTGCSTASWPGPWARPCGCTTSPAALRIGKLHKRLIDRRGPGPHADAAPRPPGRRATSTTTPRPTTPASRSPSPAPRRSTTAPRSPTAPRSSGIAQGRRRPGRRRRPVEADGRRRIDVRGHAPSSTPPACGPTRSAPSTRAPHPDSIRPAKGIHITVPVGPGAQRHRRRRPRAQGQALGLRRAVGRPHLHRHHRHRLRRARRRPAVHARGRRLPAAAPSTAPSTAPITAADVLGTWAGLRPLVQVGGQRPHRRPVPPPHGGRASTRGVVTITGGKLTTYRRDGRRHRRRRRRAASATGRRTASRRSRTRKLPPARRRRLRRPRPTAVPGSTPSTVDAPGRPLRRRGPHGRSPWSSADPDLGRAARRPASPTSGPRPSTPPATRWPDRSTTCSAAAPGPGCLAPRRSAAAAERRRRAHRPRARLVRRRAGRAGRGATAAAVERRARRRRPADDAPTASEPDRPHRRPPAGAPDPADRPRRRRRPRPPAASASTAVEVADAVARPAGRRVRRRSRPTPAERAEAEPRLVAAGHDLGPRRPGRPAAPRSWPGPSTDRGGRRRAGRLQRGPRPGHRRRRPQRRVRRLGARARRRRPRPLRPVRHRRRRRRPRWSLDVLAGTFGDRLEAELRADHGLTLGHWPQSMALSTVGGWLACRGAGQLSTRYGKIEDMVVGLDVVLADGRVIHTGGAPRAGRRPRPHPAVRRPRGHARRHHRRPAPGPPRARRHERRAAYGFASFADGLDACRRILRRGATPAVLRLYDAIEADRNFEHRRPATSLLVLDEGDAGRRRRRPWPSSPTSARGAERARRRRSSSRWLEHRNDVSALEALIGGGLRRRHHGDHRAAGPPSPRDLRRDAVAAIARRRRHAGRVAPTSRTPTPTAPASTSPSPARPSPTSEDAYYRAVWDAGTRAVLAARRRPQPPPRRRPQPGPLHAPSALGAGLRRAGRREGRPRPERHPQPGQARPAQPVRRRSPGPRERPMRRRLDRRARSLTGAVVAVGHRRARRRSSACWSSDDDAIDGLGLACSSSSPGSLRRLRRRRLRRRPAASPTPRSPTARVGRARSPSPLVQGVGVVRHLAGGDDVGVARRSSSPRCWPARPACVGGIVANWRAPAGRTADERGPPHEHPRRRRRHQRRAGRGRPPRRHRRPTSTTARCCPTRPTPGLVEFDAAVHGRRRARRAPGRALADGGPGRRRRHRQPAGLDDRVGPRPPASRSAPASAGRTCAPSATASCCRPRASASPRTCRPPSSRHLLDQADPDRDPRPVLRHRRHVARLAPDRGRGPRHRPRPTPASPACVDADGSRLGRRRARRAAHPRADAARRVVDSIGRGRPRPPPSPAPRRSPGIAGDQQASLVGQGCVRPGPGQDHLRHRRHARPRASAPSGPSFATRGAGGHLPDRRLAPRRRASRGASRRSCSRPAPTWSGCATTSASSPTPPTSHDVAAACDDTDGVVFVPALLGLGTPRWDYGARGTLLGLTRGTGPRHVVRAVLEGVAQPGRRPGRGGRGRRRLRHRRAAGRRRHDRQPDVRAGAGRRHPAPGRGLARARGHHPRRRLPRRLAVGTWSDWDEIAAAWSPGERSSRPARSTGTAGQDAVDRASATGTRTSPPSTSEANPSGARST